jgi:hypothetical protein
MDSDDEIAGADAMLIRNVLEKSRKKKEKISEKNSYGWKIGWSLERTYHVLVTKLRTTDE